MVEFDTPHALLSQESSYFGRMVRELGPDGEAHLMEVAKQHHREEDETTGANGCRDL